MHLSQGYGRCTKDSKGLAAIVSGCLNEAPPTQSLSIKTQHQELCSFALQVGATHSTRPGDDDLKTLRELNFQVCVREQPLSQPEAYWNMCILCIEHAQKVLYRW